MAINPNYDETKVVEAISEALETFYQHLIEGINKLELKKILKKKNPYLFKAKAMANASDIVSAILSAYVSSSEETIFGNEFFEPIAKVASGGVKALSPGIDIQVETDNSIYAIAVKSGTSVFNADSRKKQEENFRAGSRLAQQARKAYFPIVGYGYGKKNKRDNWYLELAGQTFWRELTGEDDFYLKLIERMGKMPEKYVEEFNDAYNRAANRMIRDFSAEYCCEDGSIDWDKLVKYNSEEEPEKAAQEPQEKPKKPRKKKA